MKDAVNVLSEKYLKKGRNLAESGIDNNGNFCKLLKQNTQEAFFWADGAGFWDGRFGILEFI